MNLHTIDIVLILGYLIALYAIGRMLKKQSIGDANYMLAARQLSLPAFVMTLVTTWYGAILGLGEFVFGSGVVAWVTNGLVWYAVYIFFAIFLSKRIHDAKYMTIADQLEHRIGKKTATIAGLVTFIMTSPAPYIFSLALVIQLVFGWPLWVAVVAGSVFSGMYIWSSGFRAVVKTDMVQFVSMYLGFFLLLFFSIHQFGGFSFLQANVPPTHFTWKGDLPVQTILVWGFLALWTLVDPNFYQRCAAAKDAKTAQKGIFWATLCWFVFDMLTLFTGLYARAAFPDTNPLFSYFTLAQGVLPWGIFGLFIISILSIIMSTIDSFLFSGSAILAKDFLQKKFSSISLTVLTKIGIVITIALSLLFIYIFQSIIGIIYAIGSMGVSSLLFPTLLSLFSKKHWSDTFVMWSMIAAGVSSGLWLTHGWLHQSFGYPTYLFGIEPMYIGLLASGLVLFVPKVFQKNLSQ